MLKISLPFKKEIYKLHGQITQKFSGLRMRNSQDLVRLLLNFSLGH